MALWNVRGNGIEREKLTVYQVQELVRAGQLRAEDQAAEDGSWKRVDEYPSLAKIIADAAGTTAPPPAPDSVNIAGMQLRLGPDGKPLPPTAEELAQIIAAASEESAERRRKTQQRITMGLTALTAVILASLIPKFFQLVVIYLRH
jgi:hypothetical protein